MQCFRGVVARYDAQTVFGLSGFSPGSISVVIVQATFMLQKRQSLQLKFKVLLQQGIAETQSGCSQSTLQGPDFLEQAHIISDDVVLL